MEIKDIKQDHIDRVLNGYAGMPTADSLDSIMCYYPKNTITIEVKEQKLVDDWMYGYVLRWVTTDCIIINIKEETYHLDSNPGIKRLLTLSAIKKIYKLCFESNIYLPNHEYLEVEPYCSLSL